MSFQSPNHYATLGLHRGCSGEQIRNAYRALAKQHHPDVNHDSPAAMARTQALNAAYEVLGDATRRSAYDAELDSVRAQPAKQRSRTAAANIAQAVHLGIQDLLRGTSLTVQVMDPAHPQGSERYELTIPPGTAPGARFRLKRAAPFERGFVQVRVKVRPDARFKVRGCDLRCDLRISTQRAAQGGAETVRGATGNVSRIAVPPRVARGEIIRVPGEGLPRPRGGRGDLLVRIVYRPEVRFTRAS